MLFFLPQNGVSTLHFAVQVGALQTVKLLIKYNVDVNASDDVSMNLFPLLSFLHILIILILLGLELP